MIGLGLFTSFLPGRASSVIAEPFDDTKTFVLKENIDNNRYQFVGSYNRNPTNGVINHVFLDGLEHTFDAAKMVSGKRSTDDGATHSAIYEISNPTDGGAQDGGAGYSSDGRLHVIYDVHTELTVGATHWIRYIFSDDDGQTWSIPADIPSPADGLNSFRTYGKLIENNGVLMKPYYKGTDEGSFDTESARYILRSTDNGATWSNILIENTAQYINEQSIIGYGDTIIHAARKESDGRGYRIHISTDNGLTWAFQGDTSFGETMTTSHPPYLDKFKVDGTDVLAFYYVNRDTKESKVIYGKPADVIAGTSGWNLNTKISFMDFDDYLAATPISGYGMVSHINNDLFAVGMAYLDRGPAVETSILYLDMPTTHYDNIKTQLGI